ncbi:MAG: bacterial Ig-like domain-containing protein [Ruminococcus sp.]|nr:bacterial Ig-like domain-containing protein [Ruminococcus sp.]
MGGASHGKIDGLNLGFRVEDDPNSVRKNYRYAASDLKMNYENMYAENYFEVTVNEPETTTSTTTQTTTTTITTETTTTIYYEPRGWISLNSQPNKTNYTIGEQLDLTGLTVNFDYYNYRNEHEVIYSGVSPMDKPNDFIINTSNFNPYNAGTYKIEVSCSNEFAFKYFASDYFATVSFEVTVNEPETTTVTTETTTTTTTTTKYTYSVKFVDEETNQAVSGVRYNIVSYYTFDPAHVVQTSGESPKSYEFISDTVYVELSTIEQAIPDGYYIPDGATRWELSAARPDLTVYLRKSETTTTETSTITTTTTTISSYINVVIDSYPTKTAYTVGEELDLSGGKWHSEGVTNNGTPFNTVSYNMTGRNEVDTSAFDNTKAGTYRIYIRSNINGLYGENFFDITVSESEITLGDVNGDGYIDAVDATAIRMEYAKLSTVGIGTFDENQKKSADLNKDGYTDSVDATLIMMYYAYVSTYGTDTLENWLFTHNI